MRQRYILFLLVIAIASGCQSSSNPTSTNSNPTLNQNPVAREFGYILNGTMTDRKDYPIASTAMAMVLKNHGQGIPPNSKLLVIALTTFDVSHSSSHSRSIELFTPFYAPVTGTFPILKWDDPSGAIAVIKDDSLVEYDSKAGGTLTITKFDTANNVVSGTFNFTVFLKTDPSRIFTISAGYFNEIPITIGSYEQGKITAMVNGANFSTILADGTSDLTAYTQADSPQLSIIAAGTGSSSLQKFFITLTSPQIGTFTFSTQVSATTATISFIGDAGSISSNSGTSGTITITKADPNTHRISGTFQLSATDASTGKTISITNGVIDNVQWFIE
ncbi:MAG: DUF6252 family protein [Bacteroidota bacterium]|nr:DUF6252 family protein [Bacteroidota bacterium]MDP4230367.1 DUF6252 family protein [Bacteroidota bacterium]MDP4236467.1 DUF6252 family protein [Bacteroidota bacterium]